MVSRAMTRKPGERVGKFDFAHRRAGLGERGGGAFHRGLGLRLRGVPHFGAAQSDPRRRIHRARRFRRPHAQHGGEQFDVVERAGQPADGVDAFRRRLHAGFVERVVGRLEAEDAAIGARAQHRAAGLGAERRRHHVVGDRRRRAARRAARRVRGIVRIGRLRRRHAGEFAGRGLAQHHRAGAAQAAPRRPRPTAADGPCRSASRTRSACRTYR